MLKKILTLIFLSTLTLTLFQSCGSTDSPPNDLPDTTSQNFTFETFEFGDGFSSSYFNDVWVFDENNIWAVGYIYSDTTRNANILRWNGKQWFLEKYNGSSSGIMGIWAHDDSNIYFANGAVLIYKNEIFEQLNFQNLAFTNGQGVENLWGSSESNIWGVGPWGTIVHNDGTGWTKIDFDRQWYFYNITGSKETGIAYAVARNTSDVCIIAEMKNNQASIIYTNDNTLPQLKSWTIKYYDQKLYLGGADILSTKIWEYDLSTGKSNLLKDLNDLRKNMGIRQIATNNINDRYYIGKSDGIGRMIHYNGVRYTEFDNGLEVLDNSGNAHAINKLCVSVGSVNGKAYLTKIMRN